MVATIQPKLTPHYVTVGTTRIGVVLPDVYEGNGSNIATIVGVNKVTDAELPQAASTVGNLIRKAQALRIKVRYVVGTKVKTASLICDVGKATSATVALVGKAFRGGEIKSAYFPRRARLG